MLIPVKLNRNTGSRSKGEESTCLNKPIPLAAGCLCHHAGRGGGAPVMELPMAAAQETAQMESVSILNIIVNIVPDNIVTAFQNADMLQVIFNAVLCGIAVGPSGNRARCCGTFSTPATSCSSGSPG